MQQSRPPSFPGGLATPLPTATPPPLPPDKTIPSFISLWKLAFGRRQPANKSFEYTLLMFISTLSLRVGRGGWGRVAGGATLCGWRDWLCVWWMGLSRTLTAPCSIHVDVQSAALHPTTSWRPPFLYFTSSQIISLSLRRSPPLPPLLLLLLDVVTQSTAAVCVFVCVCGGGGWVEKSWNSSRADLLLLLMLFTL